MSAMSQAGGPTNPSDAPWSYSGPADLAFIGASTAVGEAVPPSDNLLSQLRVRYPYTVTLGAGGAAGEPGGDLAAGGEPELVQDAGDVDVDGALGDDQLLGHLAVGQPAGDQGGDLALASG